MLVNLSVEEYLEALASGAETPGGGSASALAGALGAAAGLMVIRFSEDPGKFAGVADAVARINVVLNSGKTLLRRCIDADAEAFAGFKKVYAMPKTTPEEKAARTQAMQETLFAAMQAPLQVMKTAAACLEPLPELADVGNKNLITDTGTAAVLLEAAVRAARLNVLVNLKFLKDEDVKRETRATVDELSARAASLAAVVAGKMESAL